ncbi:Acyl-CoA dehydrogenase [Rhizobiales bacterium GAS191]|nr:Acyl-CoA dehydrogenase [Rhizobiales bacterium GAS191]
MAEIERVIPQKSAEQFVYVAQQLRREFEKTAADVDASGAYPTENMRRIHETGLDAICFPREWGGVIGSAPNEDLEAIAEIFTELAAGESSTAQIFNVHRGLTFELFSGGAMSNERKQTLHREIMKEDARICSPAAEPTKKRFSFQTSCKPVPGGVAINGIKYFATGCEGSRYGVAPVLMDGFSSVEDGGLHWVLVRLDAPGVTLNRDWDNMGQRATGSSSVTFNNVFIPDGSHWSGNAGGQRSNPTSAKNISGPVSQIVMAAIILGMGFGALDAMCTYIREHVRPTNPEWKDQTEDPITQHHIGRYSTMLAAARSANRDAARSVVRFIRNGGARADVSVAMMHAKVAAIDAAMTTAGELHRLCGGQSTANKYRLDRFWRNARTLSTHDSQDVKLRQIGSYILGGVEPPANYVT